jgi:predicted phosphoribosyltransferase
VTGGARFHDRHDAGHRLAADLRQYAGKSEVIVLALPRGGIPVGYEVAQALGAPLDVFVVRKLGLPGYEELAIGAIASGGARVLNEDVVRMYRISKDQLAGKTAILVDDGLATGATMRAAVEALRHEGPARIVVAVPVSSPETCEQFRDIADEVVCAVTPEPFYAVGLWYEDFSQTTDEEVHELLERARAA